METFFSVVASLFIIEVLLSVDNALVNATLAEALPEAQRKKAIRIGIILGALFRFIALFVAAYIIQNPWIKIVGAMYLIYLACEHLGKEVDEEGHTLRKHTSLRRVIIEIGIADIVFSLDNVVSAVSFSSNIILVITGVMIGVLGMLFVTPLLSGLIHRYRGLVPAAYSIVGLIGLFLLIETTTTHHITEGEKFGYILGILAFTFIYEHSRRVRHVTKPILKKMTYILGAPLDILSATQKILSVIKKKVF